MGLNLHCWATLGSLYPMDRQLDMHQVALLILMVPHMILGIFHTILH